MLFATSVVMSAAESTGAGIITAITTALIALGGLVTAVGVLLPILRQTKATKFSVDKATKAVAEVHTIVNQQRTDMQRYQRALVDALRKGGLEVPDDQSMPFPSGEDANPGQ